MKISTLRKIRAGAFGFAVGSLPSALQRGDLYAALTIVAFAVLFVVSVVVWRME